jgi:hypothetical protein
MRQLVLLAGAKRPALQITDYPGHFWPGRTELLEQRSKSFRSLFESRAAIVDGDEFLLIEHFESANSDSRTGNRNCLRMIHVNLQVCQDG